MQSVKVKITDENVVKLINLKQIYISNNGTVGNADYEILVFCSNFEARSATFQDIPTMLGQVVCIEETPSFYPSQAIA